MTFFYNGKICYFTMEKDVTIFANGVAITHNVSLAKALLMSDVNCLCLTGQLRLPPDHAGAAVEEVQE